MAARANSLAMVDKYLYRIISAADWRDAQDSGEVAYAEIDRRDGYFHMSTRAQALETARIYFADVTEIVALEIYASSIAGEVKFEAPSGPAGTRGGELFPHLYGVLAIENVRRAIALIRTSDGAVSFSEEAL